MLRERRAWLVPVVYAAVLATAVYLFFLPQSMGGDPTALGRTFAGLVAAIQAVAVGIFAPLVGAGTLAGERERGTFTTLLASPIARHRIVTGKTIAAVLYVFLMLSVSVPIASLSLLFGGADLATIAGAYLTHGVLGVSLVCMGVAASTLFGRTWTASIVAVGLAFGLCIFTFGLFAAVDGFDRFERGPSWTHGILWFNPAYNLFLFFAGDQLTAQVGGFWEHYAALLLIAAVCFGFAVRRVARE
jgi:ABC-type transport system involved in multi-copper enzyme maturation permease subunit